MMGLCVAISLKLYTMPSTDTIQIDKRPPGFNPGAQPDHLVGSYKCSSVNWMAVGSRLPWSTHGTFSPFY